MKIYADNGYKIRRNDEVVEYLHTALHEDPRVIGCVTDIRPDLQEWGIEAVHFSGIHAKTEQPVVIKVGVAVHELYWTLDKMNGVSSRKRENGKTRKRDRLRIPASSGFQRWEAR